jgi:hypothetical protein
MTGESSEPCPDEMLEDAQKQSPVSDPEFLLKIVVLEEDIAPNGSNLALTTTAIRKSDIAGDDDGEGGRRSVSVFREALISQPELEKRAKHLTKHVAWIENPIAARVKTKVLRDLVDDHNRREVCVYAEPTGNDDLLGPCLAHAGIRRSCDPPVKDPKKTGRLTWVMLRSKIAQQFVDFIHVCSNEPTTLESAKISS